MLDPFSKPLTYYTRTYDLKSEYVEDSALYVSKMERIPIEEARQFVLDTIKPDGIHPIRVPMARFLQRNQHGDRERRQMPLDQLWRVMRENNEILAPNLTSYLHPDVKMSLLAKFIAGNLKKRNVAKQEQLAAEREGNKRLKEIKKSAQTTFKIKNNALSGAHSSPYTILWNKSSHSTLTSGCRTATSYGNANNEKFLYGNRHYWSPAITQNNIISIIRHTDYVQLDAVMNEFNLKTPTVEDVMAMIDRSTRYYWRDAKFTARIEQLVQALEPLERAAVLFTGDLYHLAKVNPEFVHQFLKDMSERTEEPMAPEDVEEWRKRIDGDLVAYISMLCPDFLFNKETKKYEAMKDVKRPHDAGVLYANGKRIIEVQQRYASAIQAFWVTDNLPSSIYYLPNIIRRGVITSDTDSTIFTVAYWPIWYCNSLEMSRRSLAVSATMVYLTSKIIIHILARFSANCGVAQQDIFRLSMKNEYFFPVFTLTSRAKHYFAYISMQEGSMKLEMETEIKGVALRNSNVPPEITAQAHALMRKLMDKVLAGEMVSLRSVLRRVALIEQDIKTSIELGNFKWLKRMNINQLDSYKNPDSNNYTHYEMWEAVFARKYGPAPPPPYRAVKVAVMMNKKAKYKEWLAQLEDRTIAENMEAWMASRGKTEIGNMLLPEMNLQSTGIPKELIGFIDLRNLISQTMESFYLVLESLGYFIKDRHLSRLLSDNEWLIDPNNPIEPFDISDDDEEGEEASDVEPSEEVVQELERIAAESM